MSDTRRVDGSACGYALSGISRFRVQANSPPKPRDEIRHVRDLMIASSNSQMACQDRAAICDCGPVLQFFHALEKPAQHRGFSPRSEAVSFALGAPMFRTMGRRDQKMTSATNIQLSMRHGPKHRRFVAEHTTIEGERSLRSKIGHSIAALPTI
jgi:hypothetical protein